MVAERGVNATESREMVQLTHPNVPVTIRSFSVTVLVAENPLFEKGRIEVDRGILESSRLDGARRVILAVRERVVSEIAQIITQVKGVSMS
jgi:hypothetical protein